MRERPTATPEGFIFLWPDPLRLHRCRQRNISFKAFKLRSLDSRFSKNLVKLRP